MKRKIWPAYIVCLVVSGTNLLFSSDVSSAETTATLGLVGAGTVSTDSREFATSIAPDGDALYFNRSDVPGVWHIWVSDGGDQGWNNAKKLAFSDNRYSDMDPFVSRSGDRLYFSSDRPLLGSRNTEPTVDTNTWFAPLDGDSWGAPVFAGAEINSAADETFISESAASQVIFARFGEGRGRERPTSIMTAQRDGQGFSELRQIATSPASLRLSNPAISPDGKLIVATGRVGINPQLFFSQKLANGQWQEFQLLPAPINQTQSGQFAPYIANDGRTLYFSSNRPAHGVSEDNIYSFSLPDAVLSGH